MRIVRYHLSLLGDMTQLPDSQKLFGALVSLYANSTPSIAADTTAFVQRVLNHETFITLSNILPLGFLPMPCLLANIPLNADCMILCVCALQAHGLFRSCHRGYSG